MSEGLRLPLSKKIQAVSKGRRFRSVSIGFVTVSGGRQPGKFRMCQCNLRTRFRLYRIYDGGTPRTISTYLPDCMNDATLTIDRVNVDKLELNKAF